MTLLFDRRVELRLYTETEEIIFKDYDMEFEVFATSKSDPNTANITVYGLNENQRNLFNSNLIFLELYAGYKDEIGMIFRGSWDPKKSIANNIKDGPVWRTEIETGDGFKEVQTAFVNKNYSAGTPLVTVLRDIASLFGLPILFEFYREETLLHAASFTGRASQILDDLAWSFKFDWSIQHGVVLITERDEPSETAGVVAVLSRSTGLVGDPIVTVEGIELKTMMLSNIKPKSLIEIKEEKIPSRIEQIAQRVKKSGKAKKIRSNISESGIYVVDEITYYGSVRDSSEFNCTVKALF